MKITLIVEAEVAHVTGKFASRDELTDALIENIEDADDGEIVGVGVDQDSEYSITSWSVSEGEAPK